MTRFRLREIRKERGIDTIHDLHRLCWENGFDVKEDSLRRWDRGEIPGTDHYLQLKNVLGFDDSAAFEKVDNQEDIQE